MVWDKKPWTIAREAWNLFREILVTKLSRVQETWRKGFPVAAFVFFAICKLKLTGCKTWRR
jgi:hypothetical protein